VGRYDAHLDHVRTVIGQREGTHVMAAMNALMLDQFTVFITDTFVNEQPSAAELSEIAQMAAAEVRRFGLPPKVAFLSHSIYGSSNRPSARRMREARNLFVQAAPDIECDGEMHGDAALSETVRRSYLPETTLSGSANLLVLPNIDAANISYNLLKTAAGGGIAIGPVLLGAAKPVHILTPSATVRRVVNMTALTVADASAAR
jgi:malate dehydrogenase (oxaloacetate-decarboxylating)(NADP+)